MTNEPSKNNKQPGKAISRRPFFLSILGTAYLAYSGLLSLLFFVALFKNSWVTGVLTDYFPERMITSTGVLLFTISGLIIYLTSVTGTLLMLMMKRIGFYIYLASTLVIVMVPHLMRYGNWYASGIFILITILFSIYFRKMH